MAGDHRTIIDLATLVSSGHTDIVGVRLIGEHDPNGHRTGDGPSNSNSRGGTAAGAGIRVLNRVGIICINQVNGRGVGVVRLAVECNLDIQTGTRRGIRPIEYLQVRAGARII